VLKNNWVHLVVSDVKVTLALYANSLNYFSFNFLSYLFTFSHQNWNPSLNASRHYRWPGTTCHQHGC